MLTGYLQDDRAKSLNEEIQNISRRNMGILRSKWNERNIDKKLIFQENKSDKVQSWTKYLEQIREIQ